MFERKFWHFCKSSPIQKHFWSNLVEFSRSPRRESGRNFRNKLWPAPGPTGKAEKTEVSRAYNAAPRRVGVNPLLSQGSLFACFLMCQYLQEGLRYWRRPSNNGRSVKMFESVTVERRQREELARN